MEAWADEVGRSASQVVAANVAFDKSCEPLPGSQGHPEVASRGDCRCHSPSTLRDWISCFVMNLRIRLQIFCSSGWEGSGSAVSHISRKTREFMGHPSLVAGREPNGRLRLWQRGRPWLCLGYLSNRDPSAYKPFRSNKSAPEGPYFCLLQETELGELASLYVDQLWVRSKSTSTKTTQSPRKKQRLAVGGLTACAHYGSGTAGCGRSDAQESGTHPEGPGH